MKALTLLQSGLDLDQHSRASLLSNYAPSLENRVLAQSNTTLSHSLTKSPSWMTQTPSQGLSCLSLQPSSLSSTVSTSPLLSSSASVGLCGPASTGRSSSSHLLSTENTLLKRDPLLSPLSSLTPSIRSTLLPPSSDSFALQLPRPALLTEENQKQPSEDERERCYRPGDITSQASEFGHIEDEDPEQSIVMPVVNLDLAEEEEEQIIAPDEEFTVRKYHVDSQLENLKDKKYHLLNAVCGSLVMKTCAPGEGDWDGEEKVWKRVMNLSEDISKKDPEFLLKVAVYTRQELNIRITANFLLALAAHLPSTKPHVRRYFCAAIQLPSDWLEVIRIYSTCFSKSLPSCLKKGLTDKFKQFSEYQLAKYNTRKHRCKHSKKPKPKVVSDAQWTKWAALVGSEPQALQKYLQNGARQAVDKKQDKFSLKKMIERLHIKEPAEHVMAVLGKRYPADMQAFSRSGLNGTWQKELSGKRMKLKQPDTWDRLLSQEGNKAATWEKLIDSKSLPFMAMLRNLRNMISQGISERHHQKILARLTSKSSVIQSRQFPFRFLSAYKVILELGSTAVTAVEDVPTSTAILKKILKKLPKGKRYKSLDWETAKRRRLRVALGVPFVYRIFKMKKQLYNTACKRHYTDELLARYRAAIEKAVQISCRYNIPPLPGRTLVLCATNIEEVRRNQKKYDFCLPPDPEKKQDEEERTATSVQELAVLMSLMIVNCCEHAQFFLHYSEQCFKEVTLQSDVLLDNVRPVLKQVTELNNMDWSEREACSSFNIFNDMIADRTHVDNIITLSSSSYNSCSSDIGLYKKEVNKNVLMVSVLLTSDSGDDLSSDRNSLQVVGFSEQILKFISERGSSRLLDHVEHMDKLHGVPAPPQTKGEQERTVDVLPLPATPKLRWRGVRVFVSSTFRDMHTERDVLVRSVFPELRRRAAPHGLHLQEVELRWGVTEEEAARTLQHCLGEVCRSQLLLGLLGERYGMVPPRPSLPDSPQYHWINSAPSGLSITEMEIRQFQAMWPDSATSRMLLYFRSPHLSKSVPVAWRSDFVAESKEAESKMADLKSRILSSGAKVMENYPCEWGGVVDGRPYVKGLEDFGKAAVEDLWDTLQKLFIEEVVETDVSSEVKEQEVYQAALQRQFYGRGKLVSMAMEKVKETQKKGGVVMVEGNPGEGKTVFMAGLANALQTLNKSQRCEVISYSTAASQSACSVENLLRYLIYWLRKQREGNEEEKLSSSSSYKELLAEFDTLLSDVKSIQLLALLVDGADLVQDAQGRFVSDWIPQNLPQGVSLVLSVTTNSDLQQPLLKKKGSISLPLGQLSLPDRKEIVQKELSVYGKKLSDSAFNNQLQTLLMKKGAVSPLYLHHACEELRSYASFEKMKDSLQSLPATLPQLIEHSLVRLLSQYSDWALRWALEVLAVSTKGLRERNLYAVVSMCNDLSRKGGQVTWQEALQQARHSQDRIPMATFTQMARCLQSLLDPSNTHNPDDFLTLYNPDVMSAFEELFLSKEEDRSRAHLLLSAHLWVQADPQGKDTFLHCDSDALAHLPYHLRSCGQWSALSHLLSSYYFLWANVRLGLLHGLLETYASFDGVITSDMKECQRFLKRHAPLLSHWPALFLQQALNESDGSPAHLWASGIVGRRGGHGRRVVEWLNRAEHTGGRETAEAVGTLVSTFQSEPTCVVVSPGGDVIAVGTTQGTLHFFSAQTGQEVKSLVSNSDGISGCVFLKEGLLGSTSYDGRVEVWDVQSGCRVTHMDAHTNRITGSDVSQDRKHLATVSLDFGIKVWSSPQGTLVAKLWSPSPLNCVTFDPEGHRVAVGCWDGSVRVWNWLKETNAKTLLGHERSVRSLSFSPCGSQLCSGSLCGEVRLWSVPASTCVGSFWAHRGPTQALSFLQEGRLLLTAGSDTTVQLWSGGLGRSVGVLGGERTLSKHSQTSSRHKTTATTAAALCVAVANGYAAVGYHGDGVKLFHLKTGETVWASEGLLMSVPCLLWLEAQEPGVLVAGGGDHRLRVWRRRGQGGARMVLQGSFRAQKGPITALAQNTTYLASASDDFTIALWTLQDVTAEPWAEPSEVCLLRGHSGGVTCLSFSSSGQELLSGGKDQALLVWNLGSSPPSLSQSLPHCHGDWITGCAWTSDGVVSCSRDGRLRVWDVQTGSCTTEILASAPLTSLCWAADYFMAGSADGLLFVWKRETRMKITQIQAHDSCIHHCATLPNTDVSQRSREEELMVATASDDGMVKLWQPLQVHHHSTLHGHSGGVEAAVINQTGEPTLFTVAQDLSLRTWTVATALEVPACLKVCVSALCFLHQGQLLVVGYESGRVEIWHHKKAICCDQVSDRGVTAFSSMPEDKLAVSSWDGYVYICKIHWDPQQESASMEKACSYIMKSPVKHLHYCNMLLGVCHSGQVCKIEAPVDDWENQINSWNYNHRIVAMLGNDTKSCWMAGENYGKLKIGFIMCLNPSSSLSSNFCETEFNLEEEERQAWISAVTMQGDFVVYGDVKGNLWFKQSPNMDSWDSRSSHSDRISVLRLTEKTLISASYDCTVKLWDRQTKKQVGMFVCDGPVHALVVAPQEPREMVCVDGLGKLYFLSWTE
ncbi:telomerase protein component 1 [Alosa sapidissima]|uniref:telomerase protein component 1 n=1 Tax=Alosa sapidissima TaxID=34773 RepID=UPI001C090323|nr:telomerase protein component 1 [Alosa sapidissima]